MLGIAAVPVDADVAGVQAKILESAAADVARAAADPRVDQIVPADLDSLRVRAAGDRFARSFVPECERKFHAALGEGQPAPMPEVISAFPDVDVAVADPGGLHLDHDLGPFGHWDRLLEHLQRLAKSSQAV